jgi:hypothetical protein
MLNCLTFQHRQSAVGSVPFASFAIDLRPQSLPCPPQLLHLGPSFAVQWKTSGAARRSALRLLPRLGTSAPFRSLTGSRARQATPSDRDRLCGSNREAAARGGIRIAEARRSNRNAER